MNLNPAPKFLEQTLYKHETSIACSSPMSRICPKSAFAGRLGPRSGGAIRVPRTDSGAPVVRRAPEAYVGRDMGLPGESIPIIVEPLKLPEPAREPARTQPPSPREPAPSEPTRQPNKEPAPA